jgi:hypothetical protein
VSAFQKKASPPESLLGMQTKGFEKKDCMKQAAEKLLPILLLRPFAIAHFHFRPVSNLRVTQSRPANIPVPRSARVGTSKTSLCEAMFVQLASVDHGHNSVESDSSRVAATGISCNMNSVSWLHFPGTILGRSLSHCNDAWCPCAQDSRS